jgi:chaperonin GroES
MAQSASTSGSAASRLPIRMLHDRLLVSLETEGERRSGGGILIPATASAASASSGPRSSRQDPTSGTCSSATASSSTRRSGPMELQGSDYALLRERDIHAVAASRIDDGRTGLYL